MINKHFEYDGQYSDRSKTNITYNLFLNSDQGAAELKDWKERLAEIVQNLPEADSPLKPLIQFLVTTIQPTKIYKIEYPSVGGSEERPFTDLLLVIPSSDNRTFKALEAILEIPYLRSKTIRCTLYKEDLVLDRLEKGHIYFSRHCIPANLLYDDEKRSYPTTSPEIWEAIKNEVASAYNKASDKAFDFLESAGYWVDDPTLDRLPDIVIFFLHQAIELCYRSVLQLESGCCRKTHELRTLRSEVRRFAPQLAAVLDEESEEDTRLMNLLENGYLQARYALEYPVSAADISSLFDTVCTLLKGATEHVVAQLKGVAPDEAVEDGPDEDYDEESDEL